MSADDSPASLFGLSHLVSRAIRSLFGGPTHPANHTTTASLSPLHPGDLTVSDVLNVRSMLLSMGLPTELVSMIFNHAAYWPVQRWTRRMPFRLPSGPPPLYGSASLYLETTPLGHHGEYDALRESERRAGAPLSRLKPVRVVFRVAGHDQGWIDAQNRHQTGTFSGAFSWFDAGIFRARDDEGVAPFCSPFETLVATNLAPAGEGRVRDDGFSMHFVTEKPDVCVEALERGGWACVRKNEARDGEDVTWLVQRNRVASRGPEEFKVVWERNPNWNLRQRETEEEVPGTGHGNGAGFLEKLECGDRIGLWARTRFGGWENHVYKAEIEVYYPV